MTIQHVNVTDPNIHEPKGVSTAPINTTYVADGAGSGAWGKIPTQGLAGVSGNGTANQSLVVDGAGAHSTVWAVARGGTYFTNIASPFTVIFPSVYTKLAPVTAGTGSPKEFTEGANARLTYTGTVSRHALLHASVSFNTVTGANRDIRIAIYKNGAMISASEAIITDVSGDKQHVGLFIDAPVAQNDYFEIYIRNDGASGDVNVFTYKLHALAFLT